MTAKNWLDGKVGQKIDFDGYYGYQCMDLAEMYNRDIVGAPRIGGNAIDAWTRYPTAHYVRVANTPSGIPPRGSIMVWGTGVGTYGHIAVVDWANVNNFQSLDQNWPYSNGTTPAKYVWHNYNSVLGWLIPKKDVNFDQDAYNAQQAAIAAAAAAAAAEAARVAEAARLEAERIAALEAEQARAEADAKAKAEAEAAKAEAARIAAEQAKKDAEAEAQKKAQNSFTLAIIKLINQIIERISSWKK